MRPRPKKSSSKRASGTRAITVAARTAPSSPLAWCEDRRHRRSRRRVYARRDHTVSFRRRDRSSAPEKGHRVLPVATRSRRGKQELTPRVRDELRAPCAAAVREKQFRRFVLLTRFKKRRIHQQLEIVDVVFHPPRFSLSLSLSLSLSFSLSIVFSLYYTPTL